MGHDRDAFDALAAELGRAPYRWEIAALKTAHRRVPMAQVPPGHCRWCEQPIIAKRGKHIGEPDPNRSWCRSTDGNGRRCYREFLLHSDAVAQFNWLVEHRGKRCAECGTDDPQRWRRFGDGYALDWSRGSIREPWLTELWNRDDAPDCRWLGWQNLIELVSALEVDHVVPLWKVALMPRELRRPYFGPDFLNLLCNRCHKNKTKAEAADRARLRALARAGDAKRR